MRPASPTLTPQELEIMKIVWRGGQATVRDVYEALRARRQIAYTTVMTMMKILEDKGHLKKRQVDRAYVYRPAQPEQRLLRSMVREFIDRVFDGSAQPLLVHLVKDRRLTERERREIARLLSDRADAERGEGFPASEALGGVQGSPPRRAKRAE
jgi:BlaI family transcriptional regulator, penicillinase repressor